jgi:hypothetical protein
MYKCCLPVIPDDGDGGAAQPDGHIKASEVEANGGGGGGGGGTAGGDNAVAALGGGRGSDRGSVVGRWHGGSKGLK